jgi:hypothetical protein
MIVLYFLDMNMGVETFMHHYVELNRIEICDFQSLLSTIWLIHKKHIWMIHSDAIVQDGHIARI